jgi:hypothetical protein
LAFILANTRLIFHFLGLGASAGSLSNRRTSPPQPPSKTNNFIFNSEQNNLNSISNDKLQRYRLLLFSLTTSPSQCPAPGCLETSTP